MLSSGSPRRCSTVTVSPSSPASVASVASPRTSLTSDSTWRSSHWATSNGPRSPAASISNRCPSISRTPRSTGSTPSRVHARSTNDSAGSTSTATRSSADSSSTVRSATAGDPGTAYSTSPCSAAAATNASAMPA